MTQFCPSVLATISSNQRCTVYRPTVAMIACHGRIRVDMRMRQFLLVASLVVISFRLFSRAIIACYLVVLCFSHAMLLQELLGDDVDYDYAVGEVGDIVAAPPKAAGAVARRQQRQESVAAATMREILSKFICLGCNCCAADDCFLKGKPHTRAWGGKRQINEHQIVPVGPFCSVCVNAFIYAFMWQYMHLPDLKARLKAFEIVLDQDPDEKARFKKASGVLI